MTDELQIMSKMKSLLDPLDAATRLRVLNWVISALDVVELRQGTALARSASALSTDVNLSTFADLFHAANPKSERERALVAAYWIQQSNGTAQFASQQVNTELKHIGYGASNITDALSQLMSDKPSLVIQLTKSGQSKQSRKTYKVTDAGFRFVRAMLELAEK